MRKEFCVRDGSFHQQAVANCHSGCPIFAHCEAGRQHDAQGGNVMEEWRMRDVRVFFVGLSSGQLRFVVSAFWRHITAIPNAVRNLAGKQAALDS